MSEHLLPPHDPRIRLVDATAKAFDAFDFQDPEQWAVFPAFPFADDRAIALAGFGLQRFRTIARPGLLLYTRDQLPARFGREPGTLDLTEPLPRTPASYALYACYNLDRSIRDVVNNTPFEHNVRLPLGIRDVHGTPKCHLDLVNLQPNDAEKALTYLGMSGIPLG